jgi:hypothetical protein
MAEWATSHGVWIACKRWIREGTRFYLELPKEKIARKHLILAH